jgi:hypothetical protein
LLDGAPTGVPKQRMQQKKDLSLIIGFGVSPSQMIEFCQTVSHFF